MLLLQAAEIKSRAAQIGVTLSDLARDAGVDISTACRFGRGANTHVSTASGLTNALLARERHVLSHLLQLYPQPQGAAA